MKDMGQGPRPYRAISVQDVDLPLSAFGDAFIAFQIFYYYKSSYNVRVNEIFVCVAWVDMSLL